MYPRALTGADDGLAHLVQHESSGRPDPSGPQHHAIRRGSSHVRAACAGCACRTSSAATAACAAPCRRARARRAQREAGLDVPSTGPVGTRRVRTGLVRVAMMTTHASSHAARESC